MEAAFFYSLSRSVLIQHFLQDLLHAVGINPQHGSQFCLRTVFDEFIRDPEQFDVVSVQNLFFDKHLKDGRTKTASESIFLDKQYFFEIGSQFEKLFFGNGLIKRVLKTATSTPSFSKSMAASRAG